MLNKDEIINFGLELPNTYEDYPFPNDMYTVTLKHKENNKWFVLIMNIHNKMYVNVKTNPEYSELLRNTYEYIIPAYHMNKQHWNTIIVNENIDEKLVYELIEESYYLTKNALVKNKQKIKY